ncbi:unnamed protein product, partial [marine sediment metagenome]
PETSIVCPYCGIISSFTTEKKLWDLRTEEVWTIQRCDNCQDIVTMVYEQTGILDIHDTIVGGGYVPKLYDCPISIFPLFVTKDYDKYIEYT